MALRETNEKTLGRLEDFAFRERRNAATNKDDECYRKWDTMLTQIQYLSMGLQLERDHRPS
jgi:hypothetical protein